MREIKFRAWDTQLSRMSGMGNLTDRFSIRNDGIPSRDSYILMQFTGLKDKNGKEIYEGDILVNPKRIPSFHHEVVYNDGAFFEIKDGEYLWEVHHKLEIVGNIFENPELSK